MYLSAQFTGPFLVYVIGEEGIITALQKIGAHVVADNDVTDETMVDCVVVGIDRAFNYDKLRIAQRLIHKGAHFIATNRDNTFPTENGIVPGAGSIVSSVEAASGVAPVTIGKPRPAMVHLVMNKFGVAPQEVAMIGDRLDTDTDRFAAAVACRGVYDMTAEMLSGDIGGPLFGKYEYGANPWEDPELYRAHSPITYAAGCARRCSSSMPRRTSAAPSRRRRSCSRSCARIVARSA